MAEIASFGVNVDQNTRLAQNAQDTADDANAKNSANSQQIANINDPNYLSPFEKPQLEIQMDNFATIYKTDKDIAVAEGIDFTAYDAAYQAYLAYMKPLTADISTYSPIVRTTFNSMVTAVQAEQKRFNTATQAQYNQQIKKAQTDIGDGQTKYKALQSEAETMKSSVAGISDVADRAISSAGFASNAASTASQAASSALASAINAQTDASSAVAQASSAAADSKDAKQIAGAVSQSYKTLTDGSTMTIAELESGLAVKLTKKDLNGYATETWAQNKIAATADGINDTISSIKSTVDGHTTSINDLKADSSGFKAQFTTVNDTLGKQTTDIGSLQASSKELISNFDSLSTANGKNEHNISQLQQNAKGFSSTLETVKTQVQNSAVGTNLLIGTATPASITGNNSSNQAALTYTLVGGMSACALYQKYGSTFTLSYDWSVTDTANTYAGTMQQQFNNVPWRISDNSTISSSNKSGHKVTTLTLANNSANIATGLEFRLDNVPITSKITVSNMKLEKGSVATDWLPAPEDNATVTALTKVKQTAEGTSQLSKDNHGNILALQSTAKGLQTTVSNNYSDLKSQVTQTDSAWRVALSNTGQVNLVYNSGYKNNGDGWNTLGHGYFSTVPVSMYEDSPGLGVSYSGRGNTWTEFGESKHLSLPTTTIDAINVMSFAGYIKLYAETAGGIGAQLCLAFYDTNGARVTGYSGYTLNYTDTGGDQAWHYVKKENVPVPANAVTFGIQYWGYGDTVHAMFAHPMIVKASTVGPYVESTNDLATQADMTVLSKDINLRVKKGDVVDQFNIDAGGELLSTSGNSTKIVFSSPNIIFDSKNPVQIPNANIVGTLTGKTFEAGTITATTKIISSDIEASLIHSKDNSFSLNGATGDIVGPSIHAADNSWGISSAGKIHGTSITASVMDISGDGSGPNFDAKNVTPDTTTGIYSRYKYTNPNVGFDVNGMDRKMYKNGYLVINGDTFLNRTIGDWSADGGGKYVYDTMYEANVIKMRAYNYTGSNVQTDDPSSTEGSISSRLDIQPSAITMGRDWSVSNPNILIDGDGLLKVGAIAINGHHSMGTTDGSDMYFMQMNKNATNVDGSSISIHVKKLYQSSLLSLKTDIKPIDPHEALTEVVKNDVMGYHFKNDKTTDPKSVSVILDDINPIPEYYTSNIFKSADGTGRNDGNIVGYLMLSIKDLNSRLQKLEGAN